MEVESVELRLLEMPLKFPFETSLGVMKEKEFVLVIARGGGMVGYGESVAGSKPDYNEETTATVWHMLEQFLVPELFSCDVSHPGELSRIFAPIRRNNMAKAALEGAVWDLYCKREEISLAKALGGKRTEIDVGVSVGIEPTVGRLLDRVERFLEQGYKKIKVKIKPGFDVEPVRAIRDRFGSDVPLMADANSAYTLQQVDVFRELDRFGLMMIEQPLAHDDIVDHARLQSELRTPICLDESIHSAEDARKAIELGSCKVINIKIGRVGGLAEAKRLHDVCRERGAPVWCGGMLEAGVGRAHNIALASLENFTIPGDTSASDRYWERDIVLPPVELSGPGTLAVRAGPGIGYEIDEEALDGYTLQRHVLRA